MSDRIAFIRRTMFFVGRAVKTRQNVQNGPKISCGTHLLLECCMVIGLLGWGKLDLIRAAHFQSLAFSAAEGSSVLTGISVLKYNT